MGGARPPPAALDSVEGPVFGAYEGRLSVVNNDGLLTSLRQAVADKPEDVPLRLHLSRLLLLSGAKSEAAGHAQAALELDPGNEEAVALLRDAGEEEVPKEVARPAGPYATPEHADTGVSGLAPDQHGLDSVAGLAEVKKRLHSEFLAPARNPELAAKYGKTAQGGLLMYGPPGCGKTFLARALAGELGATFLAVDSATIVSSFPGGSASSVKELFGEARRRAPALLFFDEVDAVAPKRSSLRGAEWLKGMVNQLLQEMDGFDDNTGVYVVGATNAPWDIDAAMKRPGRFDRTVAVLPPDYEARHGIFQIQLADRPTADISYDKLAKDTDGYSGADIAHAVEEAATAAFERAMETGEEVLIDTEAVRKAIAGIRPSIRPWMEEAKNWVMFANQDGGLDDLAAWMRANRLL